MVVVLMELLPKMKMDQIAQIMLHLKKKKNLVLNLNMVVVQMEKVKNGIKQEQIVLDIFQPNKVVRLQTLDVVMMDPPPKKMKKVQIVQTQRPALWNVNAEDSLRYGI